MLYIREVFLILLKDKWTNKSSWCLATSYSIGG